MRIYTTAPYTVDNSNLAYVKIILSETDTADPNITDRPWRLTFAKFTSTGFYNPLIWVSVFTGFSAALNYDSFENNFPSPPLTNWDPDPAVIQSSGSMPSGSPGDQVGITIAMSPTNSFVTLDYDFVIEVDIGGGTWVPLADLLADPVSVWATDISSPDNGGELDMLDLGLIVAESGGGPVPTCFWTDIVDLVQDCESVDPGEEVSLEVWGYSPSSGGVGFSPEADDPRNFLLTGATDVAVLGYYTPSYNFLGDMPSEEEFNTADYTFQPFDAPLVLTTGHSGPGTSVWYSNALTPDDMPLGQWAYGVIEIEGIEYYCLFAHSGGA